MREPATTLTDYLLAVVAVIGLVRLIRATRGRRLVGAQLFFAGFAAAALCGGTWHGFFSGGASATPCVLWWLTLVCSGVASSGLAVVGLERLGWRNPRALLFGSAIFVVAFAAYAWWDRRFLLSVGVSIAATTLCLVGLAAQVRRGRPQRGQRPQPKKGSLAPPAMMLPELPVPRQGGEFDIHGELHEPQVSRATRGFAALAAHGARLAAAGLLLSVFGAVLQQLGVAIHPVHFDHNATYHLWLFVALPLFLAGNQRIAKSDTA